MTNAGDAPLSPAMLDAEIECYRRYLSGASAVLEYGAGGSTVMAAERGVGALYTVETDAGWLAKVGGQESVARMVASGRARLKHVDLGPTARWGRPRISWRAVHWPRYATSPWRDGFQPDLVLVDGRFRVACVLQSLLHGPPDLKIVVHDFWSRKKYHGVLRFADVIDRAESMVVLRSNGKHRRLAEMQLALRRYDWH